MKNIIYFDTETTSAEEGRLIQFAYSIDGATPPSSLLVKPPVPIEIEAMAVHHITEEMVANIAPLDATGQATLSDLFKDRIGVAYNAKFDVDIMARENVIITDYICAYKVAQVLYDLPQYKLQYLRYLWGIKVDATAHDAGGDVIVLAKVFEKMLADYMKLSGCTEESAIKEFTEITKKPILLKKMRFGKYKDRTFEDIMRSDKTYFEWLYKQEIEEDLRHTISYWMARGSR